MDGFEKFKSTEAQFDALDETLDKVIAELDGMLGAEEDCLSCDNQDSECPDCQQEQYEDEGESNV